MFSVIIPLYNKENFVLGAIESVLVQTYQNFEIIVVNDGSTDKSLEVVKAIKSDKIEILSQNNSGVSVARNAGAKVARFNFLAFLDADDTWDKEFLESMKRLIDLFPHAGIYGSNNYFLYPSGKRLKNEMSKYFQDKDFGLIEDYFKVFANLQRSPFSNSNVVIPKDIYNEMGGYKCGVRLTEDSDLWCRIALNYDVAYCKKPLATYFMALPGSTHIIFENTEYEVSKTLKHALEDKNTPKNKIESIKKLIAFQKISLIKRGILTNNKEQIIGHLLDTSLLKYYPKEYIKCTVSCLLPHTIFKLINKNLS